MKYMNFTFLWGYYNMRIGKLKYSSQGTGYNLKGQRTKLDMLNYKVSLKNFS